MNKPVIHSRKPFAPTPSKFCIFEYVYFSRPDSVLDGKTVAEVRKRIGMELAKESPIDADVVIPVPDSGVPGAIGYARESKIPFDMAIIRNHYVGRTFIQPTDEIRNLGVRLKHLTCKESVKGKRVILIDDSIVRGTTSKKIVQMIKQAGAKEVHIRVASPPTTNPCFYGIDTPEKAQLMAAHNSVEKMRELIGVDSLKYLSIDGLYKAVNDVMRDNNMPQYCDACFTGEYPIKIPDLTKKSNLINFSLLKDFIDRKQKKH